MIKGYRYKLEPNKAQRYAMARTLDVCRELYNDALYQRALYHRSRMQQQAELPALKRAFPEMKSVYAQVLQSVLDRLDKSFRKFFHSGFGFPRYKGVNRYNSFHYPQQGFRLAGTKLSLSKIGNVKIRLSRELPVGAVVKTCTVKRTVNGWFAVLTFEWTPEMLPECKTAVGIDVGVARFATFSDGISIPNPRFYETSEAELTRAQRRVSRRRKHSARRRKAVILLQKAHARTTNKRLDFLHKHSTYVVRKYGTIVVEALNVAGMSRGNLAKQILDCGWSKWFQQLSYKAAEAGRTFIAVNPMYTSQRCARCGFTSEDNRKTQAEFACILCGHWDNADHNGALNILARMEPSFVNVECGNAHA